MALQAEHIQPIAEAAIPAAEALNNQGLLWVKCALTRSFP